MTTLDGLVTNVEGLARRLRETPADQEVLAGDRMNDLRVAMWELEHAYALKTAESHARLKPALPAADPTLAGPRR